MPKINVNGLETNYTLDGPHDAPLSPLYQVNRLHLKLGPGRFPRFETGFAF